MDFGSIDLHELVKEVVGRRCNVIITGAAGAGKTTFANAFCSVIAAHERIVTIEDTAELSPAHPHVVALESQPPNLEGHGEVSVASLLRTALRLRPDRLVVGEVRGAEVLDMLHAMETGHDGSFSTCHANNPHDALRRLEAMMAVADANVSLVLTGTGDLLEPEDGLIGIGSGGAYALAAARALVGANTTLSAREIAERSLKVAADICVYTNDKITVETL